MINQKPNITNNFKMIPITIFWLFTHVVDKY